jgi:hypothetical protein
MTIPVTITGISTAVAPVGPFKVAAGDYSGVALNTAVTLTGSYTPITGANPAVIVGQTFTNAASSLTIPSVTVQMNKSGSPTDNFYAEIRSADFATTLATSDQIASSSLLTTDTQVVLTFPSPTTIAASGTFAVVIRRTAADTGNTIRLALGGNNYAGGSFWRYSGTAWSDTAVDVQVIVNRSVTLASDQFYFFGRDGTTATTLQAFKSTAPDTSWSSITTKTGFTTAILNIAGYQVGNVIHLLVQDGTMSSSVATKYLSFDAATDTFLATTETVSAAQILTGSASSGWGCSLVVRSNGNVVCFYNGVQTKVSTQWARVYYRVRTGVATFAAAEALVDAGLGVNNTAPIAVLGASDRTHLLFFNGTNTLQRHLTSANALGTVASTGATTATQDACRYDDAGTIRHVGFTAGQSIRWASADNPTVTAATVTFGTPVRATDDGTDVYALYQSSTDSDLYTKKSTDNGATFGSAVSAFVGTVTAADANVSKNQTIYLRGSNYVVPYLVNDGGTWKYNETTVRSLATGYTLTALTGAFTLAGVSPILRVERKALVTAGAIAFSGQNVTLTKSGPTIIAQPGAFNLAGQSVALRVDRRMQAGTGAVALAGQSVKLLTGYKLQVTTGAVAFTGQPVTLRVGRKVQAATGVFSLVSQPGILSYKRTAQTGTGAIVLAGTSVTLKYTPAAVVYTLTALPGAFALASQNVTLRYAHKLLPTTGTFTLAGQPVTLRYGHKLLATVGTFALAGQNVTLFHARRLATLPTTFALTGQPVTLRYAHKLVASSGAIVLSGQGVNISWSHEGVINYVMQPLTGAFALAGQPVGLRRANGISATAGEVTLSGQSVTLRVGYKTQAATGAVALSGKSVVLRLNRSLGATAGAYALSGKTVTLRYAQKMQVTAGAFALTGTSVNLAYGAGQKLTVLPGGIVLSGKPIRLIQGYTLPVAPGVFTLASTPATFIWHRKMKVGTADIYFSQLSAGFGAPTIQPGVLRFGHARVYLKRW